MNLRTRLTSVHYVMNNRDPTVSQCTCNISVLGITVHNVYSVTVHGAMYTHEGARYDL